MPHLLKEYEQPDFRWEGIGRHVMPGNADTIRHALLLGLTREEDVQTNSSYVMDEFMQQYFHPPGGIEEGMYGTNHLTEFVDRYRQFTDDVYIKMGKQRNTGENVLMHPLRIVNRFLGWVNAYACYSYQTGPGFDFHEDEQAQRCLSAAIVVAYLHDIIEDQKKFGYRFHETEDPLLKFEQVGIGEIQAYTSLMNWDLVKIGLTALTKPDNIALESNAVADWQIHEIFDAVKHAKLQRPGDFSDEYYDLFGCFLGVIKLCDRLDNAQSPFGSEDGKYVPMKDEKVAKLVKTTLHAFPLLENAIDRFVIGEGRSESVNEALATWYPLLSSYHPTVIADSYLKGHTEGRMCYESTWQPFQVWPQEGGFIFVQQMPQGVEADQLAALYDFYYARSMRDWSRRVWGPI
jgi:hypothetical protein